MANETALTTIQANKAFWEKLAKFASTDADSLQMYYAILRGVLLEVIGLALIAQATASNKLQSFANNNAMREPLAVVSDQQAITKEIERLQTLLHSHAK